MYDQDQDHTTFNFIDGQIIEIERAVTPVKIFLIVALHHLYALIDRPIQINQVNRLLLYLTQKKKHFFLKVTFTFHKTNPGSCHPEDFKFAFSYSAQSNCPCEDRLTPLPSRAMQWTALLRPESA